MARLASHVKTQQTAHHASSQISDMTSDYVSIQEAANMVGVSERTITRWIKRRWLKTVKSGHRRLICPDTIIALSGHPKSFQKPSSIEHIHAALDDIKSLIGIMVELYHPAQLSDVARKNELHGRVRKICEKNSGGQSYDKP